MTEIEELYVDGNEAFYEWEQETYGDNTPLSDDERLLWVVGYVQGRLKK